MCTYNQASQLKSMTNPFGSVTNYNYDAAGAVSGVTGSGANSAPNYINSISYKAFGGVKNITYGNTRQLSLQYNNRLFLTQWNLPNPGGNNNADNSLGYNYQYNKYGEGNTGRPDFAQNIHDSTLDRAWTYDQVGRLIRAYTGKEARAEWGGNPDGPYARGYDYDNYGNLTQQWGWGGPGRGIADNYNYTPTAKNQNPNHAYDLAGNMTNDGAQSLSYDATGQQATASLNAITMGYDGDGLRLKKVENGTATYYLRSTVLGQQTVCEITQNGGQWAWQRGYVYLGGQLLAIQDVPQNRVLWTHQEPYSKAQRITDASGAVVSGVEVEPFGLETNRSYDANNPVNQKRKFTTYDRDANGGDEAMFRRYAPKQNRFAQPDPYDGSMSLANPQSLNRYAYTQGDPVNFVDPLGLNLCSAEFSFSQCGGNSGFWGSGEFGDYIARYNLDFGGLPSNIAAGLAEHLQRIENTRQAILANEALRRGDYALALAIVAGNPTLKFTSSTPGATSAQAQQAIQEKLKQAILAQLQASGADKFIDLSSVKVDGTGIVFKISDPTGLDNFLRGNPNFYGPGILGGLHSNQVGGNPRDYRGEPGAFGRGVLQIVTGNTGGYADIDRFNPYRDVVGFLGHTFLEVLPNFLRR